MDLLRNKQQEKSSIELVVNLNECKIMEAEL